MLGLFLYIKWVIAVRNKTIDLSKFFERLVLCQVNAFLCNKLNPCLLGFRKCSNTQYALVGIIKKWKSVLDKKGAVGAVLMDLSEAFDMINHILLIAKLHAYGFAKLALCLFIQHLFQCLFQCPPPPFLLEFPKNLFLVLLFSIFP